MSDYTKATNFLSKDSLTTGDPLKVIRGSEFDAEFEAIETAVNSKADSATTYTETEVDALIAAAKVAPLNIEVAFDIADAAGSVINFLAGDSLDTGLTAGEYVLLYNNTGANITLTEGAGLTLRLSGTSLTGNRTLLLRGLAVLYALSSTEYVISGAVI